MISKLKQVHYGWVMVILAVFALVVHGLINNVFGIFLRPLTVEFSWDRGALSAAASIFSLVGGVFGIFIGQLCDKYGPRPLVTAGGVLAGIAFLLMSQVNSLWQVHVIWGFLMGIAFRSVMIPVTSTIPRWFIKDRGKAQGFTWTGGSLSMAIWPPLAQWLISSYGWRQAYVILGLIILVTVVPVAQFMKHSPQRMGLTPYGGKEATNTKSRTPQVGGFSLPQAIRTVRFWIFGLTLFGSMFCLQVISVHVVAHAIDVGISAFAAASVLSIGAIVGSIGRLFIGFLVDRVGARMVLTSGLGMLTLSLVLLLFAGEVWTFYLFAVIFGVAFGCFAPISALVTADLFGLKYLATITATVSFLGTVGAAIGPPLAGAIFDMTGSYHLAFLISAILGMVAIALSFVLLRSKSYEDIVTNR